MTLPNSFLSYGDCEEFFNKALEDSHGARVCMGAENDAMHFRFRCNQFRSLDRERNLELYPVGNKMHGASLFDEIYLTLREDTEGEWWVYARRRALGGRVEPLSMIEGVADDN